MNKLLAPLAVLSLALSCTAANASSITMVNMDMPSMLPMTDFENGTLSGWHKGGAAQVPMTIGLEGNGNHYLRYISNGPDSREHDKRVALMSGNDYRGNYTAMGVKTISARMKNNGPVDLIMHAAFGNTLAGLRTRFATADNRLAADGEWHDMVFDLENDLHKVSQGGHGKSSADFSLAEVLGNIAGLRFTHGELGKVYLARRGLFEGYNAGEEVVADLWIDDIALSTYSATELSVIGDDVSAVPLPGAVWLFASAIAGLSVGKRRKH